MKGLRLDPGCVRQEPTGGGDAQPPACFVSSAFTCVVSPRSTSVMLPAPPPSRMPAILSSTSLGAKLISSSNSHLEGVGGVNKCE